MKLHAKTLTILLLPLLIVIEVLIVFSQQRTNYTASNATLLRK